MSTTRLHSPMQRETFKSQPPAALPPVGNDATLSHAAPHSGRAEVSTSDTMVAIRGSVPIAPAPAQVSPPGYELISPLKLSGSTSVFLARQRSTGMNVAIKILSEGAVVDTSQSPRFFLEAQVLSRCEHPHLVRYLDFAQTHGHLFLVMEYISGTDLRQMVAAQGPLSVGKAAGLMRQAALGLAYLHGQGVIHRDVKPSNFVTSATGQVKLIDLGLLRNVEDDSPSITRIYQDRWLGTPDYMSPEQLWDPHEVDLRTDLYALGCTIYFLLTGEAPFEANSVFELALKHLHAAPPDPRRNHPEIPHEVAELCMRLMAKKPEDRPSNATQVADELARFTAESPTDSISKSGL